ncbi:hypothetical protein EAJ14_21825 [Parabacteroides distasonis]|nr:hypothetical protein EAJ14_21825 [Parabacteroides distasonis]
MLFADEAVTLKLADMLIEADEADDKRETNAPRSPVMVATAAPTANVRPLKFANPPLAEIKAGVMVIS